MPINRILALRNLNEKITNYEKCQSQKIYIYTAFKLKYELKYGQYFRKLKAKLFQNIKMTTLLKKLFDIWTFESVRD